MSYNERELKKQKIDAYKGMASAIADVMGLNPDEFPAMYQMIDVYMKNKKELDVSLAVFPCIRMGLRTSECVDLLQGTIKQSELEEEINKVTKELPPSLANI